MRQLDWVPRSVRQKSKEIEDAIVKAEAKDKRAEKESEILLGKWRNKAVVDSYEPGSTFKIIVAAMGLETGKLNVNDQFYCKGYKEVGGYRIHCWKTVGHGAENFVDGIKNSCNPVFMEIGERIGRDDFFKYYKAFGFVAIARISPVFTSMIIPAAPFLNLLSTTAVSICFSKKC